MHNIQSKNVLNRYNWSDLKANKSRTIILLIAIVITTVLINSFFMSVIALDQAIKETALRSVGSSSHGGFKGLTKDEYDKLVGHRAIESIAYSIPLSCATNKELGAKVVELRTSSNDNFAKEFFAFPEVGRLPRQGDEIALDKAVLNLLKIKPQLGKRISLSFDVGQTSYTQEFVLVGYWTANSLSPVSHAWVSETYTLQILHDYQQTHLHDYTGRYMASVNLKDDHNIDIQLMHLSNELGFNLSRVSVSVNPVHNNIEQNYDIESVIIETVIVSLIMLSSYLIISNVYYISIAHDMAKYGLLRTIGMTHKQIKKIIFKQLFIILSVGLPLGLLLGHTIKNWIIFPVLSIFDLKLNQLQVEPKIYILTVIFVIFTVVFSLFRPAKKIVKLSPIQAMKTVDVSQSRKTHQKSGKATVMGIAIQNVMRNKKRLFIVSLSITLSLMILSGTMLYVNGFDSTKLVDNMLLTDYSLANSNYYNRFTTQSDNGYIDPAFYERLKHLKGIDDYANIYFSEHVFTKDKAITSLELELMSIDDLRDHDYIVEQSQYPTYNASIYGLDDFALQLLDVVEGEIDIDLLKNEDYIIVNRYKPAGHDGDMMPYYNVGDKVELKQENGDSQFYTVMAIADIPYAIGQRFAIAGVSPRYFLHSAQYIKSFNPGTPSLSIFNVDENAHTQIKALLEDYTQSNPTLAYQDRQSILDNASNKLSGVMITGIMLSVVMGLIALINFINTIVTSIISRRRELALLRSVGMTQRQQSKMLIIESLIYVLSSLILTLFVGNPIVYWLIKALTRESTVFRIIPFDFFTKTLITVPIIILTALIITRIVASLLYAKSSYTRLTN